jgi:predicted O-methyltransferase YrrM
MPLLLDANVEAVLARLHAQSRRELPSLLGYFLLRSIPQWMKGRRLTDLDDRDTLFLRRKLIALARDKGEFCYLMCRALGASRIVEVGTSFGVSTIYLAAGARDNLEAAGLGDVVELRVGDARETLGSLASPIDFLLIDSWIPLARPILEMLKSSLRPGALVLCDNTGRFKADYRDYLGYVRDPANGFRSIHIPFSGGMEVTLRC